MSSSKRFSNWKIKRLRAPLEDVKEATNNFNENNLLKRGGKADVYKGVLHRWRGVEIEEDVLIRKYRRDYQFNFYEELHKIYTFQDDKFVSFYGFCDEDGERIIVLEFVVNGSLNRYLSPSPFTWYQKLFVFADAVSGLIFWDKEKKIRDFGNYGVTGIRPTIKSFKIFFNKYYRPKILICTSALYDMEDYSSDMYCFGMVMLGVLYSRKVTIEDANQYVDRYEDPKQVDDVIPSDFEPRSLSILKEIIYKCLKEESDLKRHEIALEKAFDYQWRHEQPGSTQLPLTMKIPLRDVNITINRFSKKHHVTSCLGGELYEGKLCTSDGEKHVFIKRCSKETSSKHFFLCVEMLIICDFPNLPISLLGFCVEDFEKILVFELESREVPKCLDALSFLEAMSSFNASGFELPDLSPEDIATTDVNEEKLLKLGGMPDIHQRLLLRWRNQDVMEDVVIWKYAGLNKYDSFPLFWHKNVVLIYGCFYEEGEKTIVMEYPANGSLDDYLSDPIALTWCQRLSIGYGAACVYNSWIDREYICICDSEWTYPKVKSMKIFLDKDWEAKVILCTKKHPWNGNENYRFDEFGLGVLMLEVLYGRKIRTKDVDKYMDSYERGEHVADMIDPILRKQMPQTNPRSLSVFLETAYKCLKEDFFMQRHQIKERLKDAYEDQLEHIDSMF